MRSLVKLLFAFGFALIWLPQVGCDSGTGAPEGPEMGEVQRYLQEHPEVAAEAEQDTDTEGAADTSDEY